MDREVRLSRGFTLIELLTVFAMVSLLMALLLPALASAKERARRVTCANHLRQFVIAAHLYGADANERVPSGRTDRSGPLADRDPDEHIPIVSVNIRAALVRYAGNFRSLECPSLARPFGQVNGWLEDRTGLGVILGYNYLGGHAKSPWRPLPDRTDTWHSPQTLSDEGTLVLCTDLNDWSPGERKTFAPHGTRGPILRQGDSANPTAGGVPSQTTGAMGGNVARLDGSVAWKKIGAMRVYRGSLIYDDGCVAAW